MKPDQIRFGQLNELAPFKTPKRHNLIDGHQEFLGVGVEIIDWLSPLDSILDNSALFRFTEITGLNMKYHLISSYT